jgi:3-mercaptopyruvate sulfurtransferase SseA
MTKMEKCSTITTLILLMMEQTLTMMLIKWMMTLIKMEKVDLLIGKLTIWEQLIMIKNK